MNQRQPIPAFGALGGALGIPETIADRLMMGFMFMVAMVSALIVWRQSQLELNVK